MDARTINLATNLSDVQSADEPARHDRGTVEGERLSLPTASLLLVDGRWYADFGHGLVCVGSPPHGIAPPGASRLILTATRFAVLGDDLLACCAHCCQMLPLRVIGLRHLADAGQVRNQPRCGSCRRDPYRGNP